MRCKLRPENVRDPERRHMDGQKNSTNMCKMKEGSQKNIKHPLYRMGKEENEERKVGRDEGKIHRNKSLEPRNHLDPATNFFCTSTQPPIFGRLPCNASINLKLGANERSSKVTIKRYHGLVDPKNIWRQKTRSTASDNSALGMTESQQNQSFMAGTSDSMS